MKKNRVYLIEYFKDGKQWTPCSFALYYIKKKEADNFLTDGQYPTDKYRVACYESK